MTIKLAPIDTVFLVIETQRHPQHAGALEIFEIPEDHNGDFVADLVDAFRKSQPTPPFNRRMHWPLLGTPGWEEEKEVDLDYHVRHVVLPKPGTMKELLRLVEQIFPALLDRGHPLWECYVIEGLEGNRFALFYKLHHAYADGASGIRMLENSLSKSPDDKTIKPLWVQPVKPKRNRRRPPSGLLENLAKTASLVGSQVKAAGELAGRSLALGVGVARGDRNVYLPFTAPKGRLNRPATSGARSAALVTLPLERVRRVGKAVDATVNDVIMTLVDAAANRYLSGKGEQPEQPLVGGMAMSLRREGDTSSSNQATLLYVKMGDPEAAPLPRLRQVSQSASHAKDQARRLSMEALDSFSIATFGTVSLLARLELDEQVRPLMNFLVSNMPGFKEPLYLNGARMQGIYPIPILAPGCATNFTLASYADSICIGISGARFVLPDLDTLAGYLEETLEALEAAVEAEGVKSEDADKATKASGRKRRASREVEDEPSLEPDQAVTIAIT